jgi:outer membrane protein insertion porin family
MLLVFCLFFSFLSIPTMAESTPAVLTFEIRGNDHVPVEKVLGVISNTKIGQPLDSKNVELDMQAIMETGYFADVRANTENILSGIKLIFEVVENPAFKELQITGLTKVNAEELRPFISQKPGEIFNSVIFRDDLGKAIKFCKEKKGYLVQYRATPQIIGPEGIVRLELFELKYGKIIIQGLTKTKDYVVRRELLFKEGDIIDTNILQQSIVKVMRLRLFENPEPRFELTTEPDTVDLILEVKEAVGIGVISPQVSWAPSTNEVTGSLIYSTPNLMGLGQNLSLNVNFSQSGNNTQFSFNDPWLDSKHTSFQLTMGNTETTRDSTVQSWFPNNASVYTINLKQTNLSLSLGRPFGKETTATLGLNFERNDIENPTGSPGNPGPPPLPPVPPSTPTRSLLFWDNAAELGLVRNSLVYQDAYYVNGGYYLSGKYKVSGNYLGSAYNYQQFTLEGKWFHQLFPNLVFGAHLAGDWLAGDYPDYDALYLGGMYKLRGYDSYRFSQDPGAGDLIGNQSYVLNMEFRYRYPANKNIEGIIFCDVGQITDGITTTLKSDYGIGFRYIVPFLGELGVDFYTNTDGTSKTVFIIGETF